MDKKPILFNKKHLLIFYNVTRSTLTRLKPFYYSTSCITSFTFVSLCHHINETWCIKSLLQFSYWLLENGRYLSM